MTNPAVTATEPTQSTGVMPNRSANLPVHIPPTPKQIIIKVYGKEALARSTPNSAWTGGNTTATTYIQLLPNVTKHSVMRSLQAA